MYRLLWGCESELEANNGQDGDTKFRIRASGERVEVGITISLIGSQATTTYILNPGDVRRLRDTLTDWLTET